MVNAGQRGIDRNKEGGKIGLIQDVGQFSNSSNTFGELSAAYKIQDEKKKEKKVTEILADNLELSKTGKAERTTMGDLRATAQAHEFRKYWGKGLESLPGGGVFNDVVEWGQAKAGAWVRNTGVLDDLYSMPAKMQKFLTGYEGPEKTGRIKDLSFPRQANWPSSIEEEQAKRHGNPLDRNYYQRNVKIPEFEDIKGEGIPDALPKAGGGAPPDIVQALAGAVAQGVQQGMQAVQISPVFNVTVNGQQVKAEMQAPEQSPVNTPVQPQASNNQ
jgi:hypothetical protein